ncbi:putative Serine/threonine-protein kinase PAK 1 [Blattamonas nauphoetae]|uniref:Serine/threonine-protein kinase PAK 1 n=1 Tax=Blattamonas nauphoetae TaxID=2049346 RepID=A0ABQ9XH00_9EUKA|nr:putative Serine/threonine-protein kinase PAK 1 [Blattamonas nauphoetae]
MGKNDPQYYDTVNALHVFRKKKKTGNWLPLVQKLVDTIPEDEDIQLKTDKIFRDLWHHLKECTTNDQVSEILSLIRRVLCNKLVREDLFGRRNKEFYYSCVLCHPMPSVLTQGLLVIFNIIETGFVVDKSHSTHIELEISHKNSLHAAGGFDEVMEFAVMCSEDKDLEALIPLSLGVFISAFCVRTISTDFSLMVSLSSILEKHFLFLLRLTKPPLPSRPKEGTEVQEITDNSFFIDSYTTRVEALTLIRHLLFFSTAQTVLNLQKQAFYSGGLSWILYGACSPPIPIKPPNSSQETIQVEHEPPNEKMSAKPKAKRQFQVKVPEPYSFVRKLGQGRFGSVYEVSKAGSSEHFAMKVLPFTSEEDFSKNEHEISKLQNNQHRNVVGFVDVIVEGNAHFVVLELCSCSLTDRISELRKLGTTMDRVTVFRIVSDVLAGLGFLHSRNEVYGDVKPSNILIGCDGRAKLGDFGGVVGVGTVKTSNSAECGTMQFWGPEMFAVGVEKGVGVGVGVSQAGDMWAFGLIVLELLTGESWISGTNGMEIGESVRGFDVVSNPQSRLSSGELIRSGGLCSILGSETPLSQFLREELDSTRSELDTTKMVVDQLHSKLNESERMCATLKTENQKLRKDLANKTSKPPENARGPNPAQQSVQQTKTEVTARSQPIVASDVIVAFSPDQYEVRGWTVTRIGQYGCAGCFTKPVSKGIHRLTITTEAEYVMIGVLDAAKYPKYLTKEVNKSPKAVMMHNYGGLFSAGKLHALNSKPEEGQEWSAEADLGKRTLHFFIDGVQQKHYFINIPVPLVIAIEAIHKDTQIKITFWGELKSSSVTFEGTGHNLG